MSLSHKQTKPTPTFVSTIACANPEKNNREQTLHVCRGPACTRNGGGARLIATFQAFAPSVNVSETGCLGKCGDEANVVVNNRRPILAKDALNVLGVKPDPRALRALKLKKSGDAAMKVNNAEDAARCYELSLRALPSHAHLVRGRVLCNLSLAQAEMEEWKESLSSARAALQIETSDSALLRVAQSCHVLGEKLKVEEVVKKMSTETRKSFEKWCRDWQRRQIWGKIFGGGGKS